jgi:hypothetical protein
MTAPGIDPQHGGPGVPLECDLGVVAGFLDRWAELDKGQHLLLSILPDTVRPQGKSFEWPGDRAIALPWIEACNRSSGIYWTVNICRPNLMKKAQKQDVRLLRAVWADLDPLDDPRFGERARTWQEERERLHLLALELEKLELPPTVLIDSGNGVQAIWRLADPIEANDEYIIEIERLARRIECALGGLENTTNVDRVLRLPGTINWPNAKKRGLGRVPMPTGILFETGHRYSWADLREVAARLEDEPPEHAAPVEYRERGYTNGHAVHLDGLPDYPTEEQIESLLENHPNLHAIWDQTTLCPPEDTSPSGWDQSFASTLAALGFPPERVASYLRAYRAHHAPEKGKQDRADYILRTVEFAQPADAYLGDAKEPGDCPPYQAGPSAGASSSNSAGGHHQTAGDSQGKNRGTFNTGATAKPTPRPQPADWPDPGSLTKVEASVEFPTQYLPSFMRQWCEHQAENMNCPTSMLAIPALVAAAGSIGAHATLRAKRNDWSWVERPCLWGIVIAEMGAMKSSAIKEATSPLRAAEARAYERWKLQLAAWEARQERGRNGQIKEKPDDPKPSAPKLVMTDATIEAIAEAMAYSRGLTLVRDEGSGWLHNMSRYSKGSDRPFFLECHAGGPYTVDRILRGNQRLPQTYLSVIIGIQPNVARLALQSAEGGLDDGLLERFGLISYTDLPAWQGVKDKPPERDHKANLTDACLRLSQHDWSTLLGDQPMLFDDEAQAIFYAWLDSHMQARICNPEMRASQIRGFLAKGQGLVLRLCATLHLFKWTCGQFENPKTIDAASLNAAIGIFESYLVPTYRRLAQAFGQPKGQSGAEKILDMIKRKKMGKIRFGEIFKMNWAGLRERDDIMRAMAVLEDADIVVNPGTDRHRPKGGRPGDAWVVNPKVHRT